MRRVLTLLIVTAVLTGCSRKPGPNIRIDPALATLIPSDTVVLAGVRVEAARETPVYKKYEAQFDPQLDELAKRTGIETRKGLWDLLFASNGKDSLAFARGKFSEMGLEPKLEAQGAKRFSHRSHTLLGNEDAAVTFINPTTAVAGRTAVLRSMLDAKDRPKGGNVPVLLRMVQEIPSANQIWAAGIGGVGGLPVPPGSNLANFNRLLQSIQSFQAGVSLGSGLKLYARAICASDAEAKQIQDTLKGLVGLGRLSTPTDRREMLRFYDAIHISTDKNVVLLDSDFTEDLVENLMQMIGGRADSTSSPESRPQD